MAADGEWSSFSLNSSWHRENRRDEWSPRSQESDREPFFDSDEENNASKGMAIKDSTPGRLVERESFAPLVPWYENASFSKYSSSSSLVFLSEKSKAINEESTIMQEHVAKSFSNSLVVGKRPRAQGLKDIDLSRNPTAKHIREAKEANKSPKKSKLASPLVGHWSCPTFSHTNESSVVLPDRPNTTGKTGVIRNLSFQALVPSVNQSTIRRRVSKLTFSDDEDSHPEEQYKDRESVSSKQTAKADEEISPRKKLMLSGKFLLKMGCIFTLGTILTCLYLHVNPHGLCLDSEFVNNISGIGDALKEELYGQHIAQKIITVALQNHFSKNNARKPLVFSFHGWTGTGKNYVSNIITEHIFKHKMHSYFLHKFIVPLHFPHKSEVNTYKEHLKQWIRGNISHCSKGGVFIFDEMDKIHTGMMATIKDAILDFRGKSPSAGYQNMVFIFLSNSGGQAINEHVLRHVFDGKLRESLTLSELENLFLKMINDTPDMWFADLVKEDVIDHIVPFLPLERMHIKQCIRKDLRNKGFNFKEAMVTDVADQMEYFPPGHEFFSVSGCKKVSSRVDVTIG